MAKVEFIPFQPIEGVPVAQVGDRFIPTRLPSDYGCNGDRTVFWFIYEGTKKGKLTIDTVNNTEVLEEVE